MHKQFNQASNRLEYGSLLYPMPGKRLSFAVGTTYSLDLEALLSVPISFGMLESPDPETINNPIIVLEAIRRCSEKIALFCNVDGIKMPQDIKPVYSLLENSVIPVNLGKGINFHPKLWVVRYENDSSEEIRVIILSRNLTFDRSMDIAVEMTGVINRRKKRLQKKHKPLSDLLNFLSEKVSDETKKAEIKKLSHDVMLVDKFDIDNQYEEYSFLPFGFSGYKRKAEGFFEDAVSELIVSPFLSKSVLKKMTDNAKKKILITRLSSVKPDIYALFDEVYVPVAGIENDNVLEDGEPDNAPKRDLHAKVMFKENGKGNYLYLGSLNATENAFYRNIEIMLELKFKPYMSSLKQVKEDFVGSIEDQQKGNSAFQRLLQVPEAVETDEAEEMVDFSDVFEAISEAKVSVDKNVYCIELQLSNYNGNAEIKPLFGSGNYKKLKDKPFFERMTLEQLSEFYAVRKKDKTRVLRIETKGIPTTERDNKVFNSLIDTRPKFMQYLLFLLAEDPSMAMIESDEFFKSLAGKSVKKQNMLTPTIYERMLLAAARDPKRLEAIRELLKRIDKKIFEGDERFESMLKTFFKAIEGR